ncbi:MAG: DUF4238 domain-containing protein [Flavobacteriales bacterium]|nr:DUF4238 domain-containing protein [Flavobacteriales bacterium]
MASQETKHQHYVPQGYMKGFATPEGGSRIHFLRKEDLSAAKPSTVGNLCAETNGYTISGSTEAERQFVENTYGRVWEDNYKRVYDAVTDDSLTHLDDDTRRLIIGTVTSLLFRTRKLKIILGRMYEEMIQDAINVSRTSNITHVTIERYSMPLDGRSAKELAREYERTQHDGQVLTQLRMAITLANVRKNDRVDVIKLDSEDNFVTSDHPVSFYNPSALPGVPQAPFTPTNILSLPINHKYRIDVYPPEQGRDSSLVSRITHRDLIAKGEMLMNHAEQSQTADLFILGEKTTLQNFGKNLNDQGLKEQVDKARNSYLTDILALASALGTSVTEIPTDQPTTKQ